MEIVYGVVLLLFFLLGISIGLAIPFFIKKYLSKTSIKEIKEEKRAVNLTADVISEWQNGGR